MFMETETDIFSSEPKGTNIGLKYGLIAAGAYVVLLLVRYLFLGNSPMVFTGVMFLSYLLILFFYFRAGLEKRRQLGGQAEIRDLFSTIFIVILIAETTYAVFNYVYLNFIDPEFSNRMLESSVTYLREMGGNEEVINNQIEKMQSQQEQNRLISTTLRGLATWIIVDSIIGFIIAMVLRKKRATPFEIENHNQF